MIKVGVIGCGDVAMHSYLPGLKEFGDRAEVVALFDIVEERVEAARGIHPGRPGIPITTRFSTTVGRGWISS